MLNSHWAVVHGGKIELAEPVALPESARVLITVLPDGDDIFWQGASGAVLATIWDNAEDDVYARLLGVPGDLASGGNRKKGKLR